MINLSRRNLLAFAVVPLMVAACGGGGDVGQAKDGLVDLGNVAFWSFDNMIGSNAPNTKFSGLDAVLNQASVVPGHVGNGVLFNANVANSYAEITGFTSSGNNGGIEGNFPYGYISIGLWIKPAQISIPANHQLFGGGHWGVQSFSLRVIDGKVSFLLNNSHTGQYDLVASSNSLVSANVWTHIAVAYNGTTARIYLNGQLDSSTTISHAVDTVVNNLYFGGYPDMESGVTTFSGTIDEVLLTQKSLTSAEVAQLAAGVAP